MTNKEAAALDFIARGAFAGKFDSTAAMLDFPTNEISMRANFLCATLRDVKAAADSVRAGCDSYAWTAEFKAAFLPSCVVS